MRRAPQGGNHLRGRGPRVRGLDAPGVLLQRGDAAVKGLGGSQGSGRTCTAPRSLGVSPVEACEIVPPQDLGEPLDRAEAGTALGGNPTRAVWGEGATGDAPMDMEVVLERLPPGMAPQGKTACTAEPRGVPPERLPGGRGAPAEEAVEELGMALGQGVARVRQGQDTMKRGHV
jgi:hypothetical protein